MRRSCPTPWSNATMVSRPGSASEEEHGRGLLSASANQCSPATPSKGPHHHPYGTVGALGEAGALVGYSRMRNTFMVGNATGHVFACRSVTRRHEGDRMCADIMSQIQTKPNDFSTPSASKRVNFADGATDAQPTADASAPAPPRDMRISKKDFN